MVVGGGVTDTRDNLRELRWERIVRKERQNTFFVSFSLSFLPLCSVLRRAKQRKQMKGKAGLVSELHKYSQGTLEGTYVLYI